MRWNTLTCLVALFVSGCLLAAAPARSDQPAAVPAVVPESVPRAWLDRVQRRIHDLEYHASFQTQTTVPGLDEAWHVANRAQNLRGYFTPRGVRVVERTATAAHDWQLGLDVRAWGRGSVALPLDAARIAHDENRVELSRPGLVEWYVNTPDGLEQGFTIPAPPATGGDDAPLYIEMELTGDLRPKLSEDRRTIDFLSDGTAPVVRYASLWVADAAGRELDAWLEASWSEHGRSVRIVIDDRDAVYPLTVDPVIFTPVWSYEPDVAGAEFGMSVASAGDVNGDGFTDVIVGAPLFDNGQQSEGRVFSFYGSSAGLPLVPSWEMSNGVANAWFGYSVNTAGDVNGDGFSDVIVGAARQSGSQLVEGRVYAYHGSASGLNTTFNWSVDSDQDQAQLGFSVAPAGDLDGDGFGDVVVGAPFFDGLGTDEGVAWVFLGSLGGLGPAPDWVGSGTQSNSGYGFSVATAGDVNGDGFADLIVGAPFHDGAFSDNGRAFVYHGSPSGPSTSPDAFIDVAQNNAWFGHSVDTAGDVNGDGYADLIVGARFYDNGQLDEGAAFVFLGSDTGVGNPADIELQVDNQQANFGYTVSSAGDVNGDGYGDVIVGAPFYENGELEEGAAFVFEGSANGTLTTPIWQFESDTDFAKLGEGVSTAGDVNGDGYSDVIVGAPGISNTESDEGRALAFYGTAGGPDPTPLWTDELDVNLAQFGLSVATAGDVDGDGFGDLLVGAPFFDNGIEGEGAVFLYSGTGDLLDDREAWLIEGDWPDTRLGISVAGAGDVDGDGYEDILIGALGSFQGTTADGVALLFAGTDTIPSTTPSWQSENDQPGSDYGWAVAGLGDVNGDGYADVAVGAPNYDSGEVDEGIVNIFLGSSTGLENTSHLTLEGNQAGAGLGYAVSTAGDVHRDGLSDVLIGAPFYDGPAADTGRVFAHRGTVFGVVAEPFWTADIGVSGSNLGFSVSTAGDVDGDAHADVIVGAPLFDNGQVDEGAAFVYMGSATGLDGFPAWTVEGDQDGAGMGHSVNEAGDLNGDGLSDVIVGAPFFTNGQNDEGYAAAYAGSPAGLATTPIWSAEGDQADAQFGRAVAFAGDVNADGYADIVVGAPLHDNGSTDEGRARVYYGNGFGAFTIPQQRQPNVQPPVDAPLVAPLGLSADKDEFLLTAFVSTPFGGGRVKLQWEVKPVGTAFDGVPTGTTTDWVRTVLPTVPPIAAKFEFAQNLEPGQNYHWRVRLLYDPAFTPYQQSSRWLTVPRNGWEEPDIRLFGVIELGITGDDSKDPVFVGEPYSYTFNITNGGPDSADTWFQEQIPTDVTVNSITPSVGSCFEADQAVTCAFGKVFPGASVDVDVTAQAPGLKTIDAEVSSTAVIEPVPSDNFATVETTVVVPGVGNRVWEDTDGDGVQDGGEPGMANVLVALYDDQGGLIDTTVTGPSGGYSLSSLTYAQTYQIRFFPPPNFVLTMLDQGGDDDADSDADPITLLTPLFSLVEQSDLVRWDAGLIPFCDPPDESVFIASMAVTDDGNMFPILNFLDPNQPSQTTGYNVYRSSDPVPPPNTWPLLASDVVDMDEATPNKQYIDTTGDVSPSGIWYYEITAFNNRCPAEGPF